MSYVVKSRLENPIGLENRKNGCVPAANCAPAPSFLTLSDYFLIVLTLEMTMSDGPHRTLPMRKHWKDLAERAAKAAHSADNVAEALPHALKHDLAEAPLDAIRTILGGKDQETLFADERVGHLDSLRQSSRGSATANIAIECAIDAVMQGLKGDAAFHATVENTCDERARSGLRSVEEHYQRQANARSARYVRDRMDEARQKCDFKSIASEIVISGTPKRSDSRLSQHTGIDEGPKL